MVIATDKLKSMVISKEPIHCKLETDNVIIVQIIESNWVGSDIAEMFCSGTK